MAMRASHLLRLGLIFGLLGACGDSGGDAFPPEQDGSATEDAPTFDVPTMDSGVVDTGTVDRGAPVDNGRVDRGPTPDRGGGDCPASCTASAECDPCRTADTPDTVQYCCISGLCVSMTGACNVPGDVPPGDSTPGDASEGGTPGGDGGDPFDDAPDPDDAPDEDAGTPPPVDAGSEAGTGAETGADGGSDAGSMDAAASSMDAAG